MSKSEKVKISKRDCHENCKFTIREYNKLLKIRNINKIKSITWLCKFEQNCMKVRMRLNKFV